MAPSEHNDSAAGAAPETPSYDPKPSLQYASAVGLQAAGIGALVSAVQNALGTHTSGAAGFLTRTGGTIGFFGMLYASRCARVALTVVLTYGLAAMGATFALTESVVANQRQIDDPLNGAAGGCAAGFLAGIRGACIVRLCRTCWLKPGQHVPYPWRSPLVLSWEQLLEHSTTMARVWLLGRRSRWRRGENGSSSSLDHHLPLHPQNLQTRPLLSNVKSSCWPLVYLQSLHAPHVDLVHGVIQRLLSRGKMVHRTR